jgi:hypothetical protein
VFDLRGQSITREHVLRLLPLLRLAPEQEERLLALHYPVDYAVVAAAFESAGIDAGVLVDRMGGSP